MGSNIFFIISGFFCFGGCTTLEDCALAVFSVVLSWLGGFFCGAFKFFLLCFGGWVVFSVVLWWFFLLLMALALPPLVFSTFLAVIREGCHYRAWTLHLNNGSCTCKR
jgi:hypothetical protein